MWYSHSFRRHLCDMHIDDWNDEFLADFSPAEYLNNLKKAKLDNAMIYLQSHVGLCNFPTKTGKMHNAFKGREDSMKRLTELCRENGIAVTGYYSLIYNNWAHDAHPEWRMVDETGKSKKESGSNIYAAFANNDVFRYGLCCPNNPNYREFVAEQIKEMSEYFDLDGMFYDMPFWPHPCLCDSCQKRWKKEVLTDLAAATVQGSPEWALHLKKRREWMGEFVGFVTDITKKLMPHVSVEHNFANAAYAYPEQGCAEEVNNACDYVGGDLYGDSYSQSFVCKFYRNISKHQPFEYMFSKCENLQRHTSMKSEDEMLSAVYLTSAHHGATLVIDAINPNGSMDYRLYERLGKVFEKTRKYEKYFSGTMIEDVGVYNTFKSRFGKRNEPYNNHECTVKTVKNFVKNNVLCGVCGRWNDLSKYKTLICSLPTEEDSEDFPKIIEYVKGGGNLYISGGDCGALLKEFFGAKVFGTTREHVVYIAPEKDSEEYFEEYNCDFPLHFDGYAPIVEGMDKEKILAKITLPYTAQDCAKFASIHSNPPGIKTDMPSIAFTEYGVGRVLWSAMPLEALELYDYERIFLNLIQNKLNPEATLTSTAPEDAELVAFEGDNFLLISCVGLNVGHAAKPIPEFEITVRSEKAPTSVERLEKEEPPVEYTYENGKITFKTKKTYIFDMYKINF